MKIIAIPDLHLDRCFNVTYGDASLLEQHPYTLAANIIEKEQENNTHFLFLGDVFNTDHPSFHSIFKFLSLIADLNTVTIISGNHDIPKVEKKSVMDYISSYAYIVSRNEVIEFADDIYAIGWCDTQTVFVKKLKSIIEIKPSFIFLHAAYNNWDNEMDNVVTDDLISLAKKNKVKLISGHEHVHNIKKSTLYHLGSIMPFTIGELGPKYYWSSKDNLVEIEHGVGDSKKDNFIITRKDIDPQDNKPIMIRKKAIKPEDLVLEKQELDIDILEDFKKEAKSEGFTKEFLGEYLD